MSVKFGNITIKISFSFAVFLAFAANIAGGSNLLLSFLFSFLHEVVHLIFLRLSGIKKAEIILFPAAVKICCEGLALLSYKKTIIATLSAPVFNISAGAVFAFLYGASGNDIMKLCCTVNLLLGAVNLLPLSFLDGGRALSAWLFNRYEEVRVQKITGISGIAALAVLFLCFLAGVFMGKVQIFLLFFCIYCLVGTVSSNAKDIEIASV